MVCTHHTWPHQTVTHSCKIYLDNKGLASLQTGLLIICCICLDMTLPFSAANNPGNILHWILLSHHPDDVIIISSRSSPNTDLNDEFMQPPGEQVLQLISNTKQTPVELTQSITAI